MNLNATELRIHQVLADACAAMPNTRGSLRTWPRKFEQRKNWDVLSGSAIAHDSVESYTGSFQRSTDAFSLAHVARLALMEALNFL